MILVSNPQASYESQSAEIDRAIRRVLHGGHYIGGDEVERFEKKFAEYTGAKYCVSFGSGTDAMRLAITVLLEDTGNTNVRVATVSLTSPGTVAGFFPFVDSIIGVDINDSFTMDANDLQKVVDEYPIDVIVPVHLYGNIADMAMIKEIARPRNIPIIEDCCQAHGSRVHFDQHVGTIGDMGVFSFYPTKNLGAIGDGGAVITSNVDYYNRLVELRNYGWKANTNINATTRLSGNSRLDAIQAAILSVKLELLDYKVGQRKRLASWYKQYLNKDAFTHVDWNTGASYHQFVVMLPDKEKRDAFRKHMYMESIQTSIHYPLPLHKQDGYKYMYHRSDKLPKTSSFCDRIVSLPIYPELEPEEIAHVIEGTNRCSETL